MTDLHIHTEFSFDSDEPPESYVKEALSRGDKFIGFSEHCEYNMREYDGNFPLPDIDGYFSRLDGMSRKYPEITVLKGVELGYSDGAVSYYKKLLASHPFDHAVMSVHTVGDMGDCYYPTFYDGLNKRDAYMLYLDEVLKSVRSDVEFQIVGHIGYIARYAPYVDRLLRYNEFQDVIDKILRAVIDRGLCLELNTSVAGSSASFVPSEDIAMRYVELGGKNFSFGSDAHDVGRYADGQSRVKEFLSSLGICHTLRFERRVPVKEIF